ncbi:hypothetical protein H5410_023133 [Solanum commersonii]|uniref:Vetispiradiene synthase n=1 Tax=Solanum commersonii TaxID=4109 RepID=A0A9J5ZJ64_SOLCO|nr:hypothetical protein H5410_023133 [Solanum commersonii]
MTSLAGNVNHENGIFRLEANFSPSLWGNIFSNSTRNNQISEQVIEEIEGLIEEVKHMIINYFNQFKDNNGEFKKTLVTNAKGLLSLYEATHVRKHGDDILEDALIFAKFHLERITHTLDSTLEKQVTHALMQCLHRGIPRAEVHFNISIYEECESRNEKLLRLAKLDYNLLQVLHKEELSELTQWDISEVDRLPNYMKPLYTSLLDLFNEYEIEIELEQDRFNGVHYVKEAVNALVTGTYYLLAPTSLLGMKSRSKKTFDWMMNKPKILVASAIIGRVIDDIATYKKEKGQLVTGIECYMQENNFFVEKASAQLSEIAENAWKDLNKECIKSTDSMPTEILMRVLELTRLIDVVYKNNQDGYSDPKNNVKFVIEALLVNPIDL